MGWKQWPSWVKGGVIGVSSIIFCVVLYFIIWAYPKIMSLPVLGSFFTLLGMLVAALFSPYLSYQDSFLHFPLPNAIIWTVISFLLGALLGWIVGKIKVKNN